jgi:voltage-gated potassium channel
MWEFIKSDGVAKRFYRKEMSPLKLILLRVSFVIVLLLVVAWVFWYYHGDHISDTTDPKGDFSYLDSLYFTIISVTTVGYGDIVPITEEARLFDALIITPVRIVVWVLFIGTAYQLVIQRYWERYKMNQALKKMKGHVILTGYGTTGVATVKELMLNGYDEDRLIVIDTDEGSVGEAAEAGATGILGDPTREELLAKARVGTAGTIIAATPKDDTNVLITLTAKDMNPKIKVIARVSAEENIKQLKRAGADIIVSPSLNGGYLMAMAVSKSEGASMMSELLTTSRGANVVQRRITETEVGKPPKTLRGGVVLGIVRGGKHIGPKDLDGIKLARGDEIIIIG